MKRVLILILVVLFQATTGFTQVDERIPPKAEELEAQTFAAEFFNRYQNTQDIAPVIGQFFIKDFSTRLRACKVTGGCRGFARDFWGKDEELVQLKGTEEDHLRRYANSINYLFLYFRTLGYLADLAGKDVAEFEDGGKRIQQELSVELKAYPDVLKLDFFSSLDEPSPQLKSLLDFRELETNREILNAKLRGVERKFREDLLRRHPKTDLVYTATQFRVFKERNSERFFGYPVEVQIYDVWTRGSGTVLKIDMIREGGKLKIVAVYPPID